MVEEGGSRKGRHRSEAPDDKQENLSEVTDFVSGVIDAAATNVNAVAGEADTQTGEVEGEDKTEDGEELKVRALRDVPGGELESQGGRSLWRRSSPAPSSLAAEYWSGSETVTSIGDGDGSAVASNNMNGHHKPSEVNMNGYPESKDVEETEAASRGGDSVTGSNSSKAESEASEGTKSASMGDSDVNVTAEESITTSANGDESKHVTKAKVNSSQQNGHLEERRRGAEDHQSKQSLTDSHESQHHGSQTQENLSESRDILTSTVSEIVRTAIDQAAESTKKNEFRGHGVKSTSPSQNSAEGEPIKSEESSKTSEKHDITLNKAAMQKELYNLMKRMVPEQTEKGGIPYGDFHARISGKLLWLQTIDSVTISVCVPKETTARQITVTFGPKRIFASVAGQDSPLINGDLGGSVSVDDCIWSLETKSGSRVLTIELEKKPPQWWSKLQASDDASTYRISSATTPPPIDTEENHGRNADAQSSSQLERRGGSQLKAKIIDPRKEPLSQIDVKELISTLRTRVDGDGPGAGEAASKLAELYYQGIGVEKNFAEAVSLYKYALVKSGVQDDHAAYQLGRMYNTGGHGLSKDSEEAFRWWRIASSMGHAIATHNVGVLYLHGDGCEADPVQAESYFRKARTLDSKVKQRLTERRRNKDETSLHRNLASHAKQEEERMRMREAGIQTMKYTLYGSCAVIGVGLTAAAIMHWWRNRL